MFFNIVTKEEVTNDVFANLKYNFAISRLGHLVDLLFNECMDALAAVSTVANFDKVTICVEMNTSTLGRLPLVNVKDFGVAKCNALGWLLADTADKSRIRWNRTFKKKHVLGGSNKFNIIKLRRSMRTVQVVIVEILALKVADTNKRPKGKTEGVSNIGGLGLGRDMAIVTFIHALYGSNLGPGGECTN